MKTSFTRHCFDRYKERMHRIDSSHIIKKDGKKFVKARFLEKEIKNGVWYSKKEDPNTYLILYNNLKVYIGYADNFPDIGKTFVVETAYPFTQSVRKKINKEFERCESLFQ